MAKPPPPPVRTVAQLQAELATVPPRPEDVAERPLSTPRRGERVETAPEGMPLRQVEVTPPTVPPAAKPSLSNLWSREPSRIVAVVSAALLLATAVGLTISAELGAAIIGFVSAVVALAQGEVTRSQVSSPATVQRLVKAAAESGSIHPPPEEK